MVAIPTHQTDMAFTFAQPASSSVAHTHPMVTMPNQIPNQSPPGYYDTCTLAGKKCPTPYPLPLNLDWSNAEEEADIKKQNEAEHEIED